MFRFISDIKRSVENKNRTQKIVKHTKKSFQTFLQFFLRSPNCVCQKIISTASIAYPPRPFFSAAAPHNLFFVSLLPLRKRKPTSKKKIRATFPLYFDGTQNMEKNCVHNGEVYKFRCNYTSQNLLSW